MTLYIRHLPRLDRQIAHEETSSSSSLPLRSRVKNLEPPVRIELTTCALQVRCSTTELERLAAFAGNGRNYGS